MVKRRTRGVKRGGCACASPMAGGKRRSRRRVSRHNKRGGNWLSNLKNTAINAFGTAKRGVKRAFGATERVASNIGHGAVGAASGVVSGVENVGHRAVGAVAAMGGGRRRRGSKRHSKRRHPRKTSRKHKGRRHSRK